jgi:hypothetical protein
MPDQQFHTYITSPPYYRVRDWDDPGRLGMENTIDERIGAMTIPRQ